MILPTNDTLFSVLVLVIVVVLVLYILDWVIAKFPSSVATTAPAGSPSTTVNPRLLVGLVAGIAVLIVLLRFLGIV